MILISSVLTAYGSTTNAGSSNNECHNASDCDYPHYVMIGTSQANLDDTTQIKAAVGSKHTVDLAFQSKYPVTNLTIDNLGLLPNEWSNVKFNCPTLDSTHLCILTLQYSPTSTKTSNLNLTYSYTLANNTKRSAKITLNYAGTEANNINAVVSVMKEIPGTSSYAVTVSFVSDNANTKTNLQITHGLTNLGSNNSGWSGPTTFSCSDVAAGKCVLNLKYTPPANNKSGILVRQLQYKYINDHKQTVQAKAQLI